VVAPSGSIHGHLTGSATVVLTSEDRFLQHVAFPDEKGEFAFLDLPPGRYSVLAVGPNGYWSDARWALAVDVAGGAPTPLELHMAEAAR
jgi:hypothetical protein